MTAAQQKRTTDSVQRAEQKNRKRKMTMENRPIIKKEQVETVYDSRFIKVFDLQYEPGKHYFDATRRAKDNLAAVKSDEEFRQMLPDAVSCVVILKIRGQESLPGRTFSAERSGRTFRPGGCNGRKSRIPCGSPGASGRDRHHTGRERQHPSGESAGIQYPRYDG